MSDNVLYQTQTELKKGPNLLWLSRDHSAYSIGMRYFTTIIFALILLGPSDSRAEENAASSRTQAMYDTAPPDKVVSFTLTMLDSLSYMNAAWPHDSQPSKETDLDAIVTTQMRELLDSNKYLEKAELLMSGHKTDNNEVIKLTATSITTGCRLATIANLKYIEFLKNLGVVAQQKNASGELQLAIATYQSDRKDAYLSTITGATSLLMLYWRPAESEHPTGKIPWRLSDKQRAEIRNAIEKLFGEDIKKLKKDIAAKTSNYAAIPIMMNNFISKLLVETYEEGNKKKDA